MKLLLMLVLTLTFVSCEDQNTFREDVVMAGGIYVKADHLNLGKRIYTEYCMACHGKEGDGNGPAAKGLYPPPRNFKLGIMKFGNVLSGENTHDDILKAHLVNGLNGSAMLPWDLSEEQQDAVIQYVKTFAPDTWIGKDKSLGEKIEIAKDPFGLARRSAAIEKGKAVYHVTANCQSCHRAYETKAEIARLSNKLEGVNDYTTADFDDEIYALKPQDSDHGYKVIPPDFTWHELRSINNMNDLYLRLAAGVGGTAMPAWKDTITDEEIWAVAYYVKHLMDMKKDPESRKDLMRRLQNQ